MRALRGYVVGGVGVVGGSASAVGVGDRSIGAARRRITMTVSARVGIVFGHVVRVLVYFVGYIQFMCPMIAMEDMVKGLAGAAREGWSERRRTM